MSDNQHTGSEEIKKIGEPSPEAIKHAKRLIALKWTRETSIDVIAGTWQAGYVMGTIDATVPAPASIVGEDKEEGVDMNDPFIKKHLARIWELTKDAKIDIYIKPMFDALPAASVKYFLETGTVNGFFREALHQMMDSIKNYSSTPSAILSDAVAGTKKIQEPGETPNNIDY